jgi:hypothetical protein
MPQLAVEPGRRGALLLSGRVIFELVLYIFVRGYIGGLFYLFSLSRLKLP